MQPINAKASNASAQTVASDDIMSYMTQVTKDVRITGVKESKQVAELV